MKKVGMTDGFLVMMPSKFVWEMKRCKCIREFGNYENSMNIIKYLYYLENVIQSATSVNKI